jgi:hypothetical protein
LQTGRRPFGSHKPGGRVRLPGLQLNRPGTPTGRGVRLRASWVWVRLPLRSLSGTPAGWSCALQARRRGSTPRDSTADDGHTEGSRITVRRSGLLNRAAPRRAAVGSTPTPSARRPGGETEHHAVLRTRRSRFESWPGHSTTRLRSLAAKAPVLQTGDRWFESTRGYLYIRSICRNSSGLFAENPWIQPPVLTSPGGTTETEAVAPPGLVP